MHRIWYIFQKCAIEQKRDLWVLFLSLLFAPLFVFIYWLITNAGGSTSFGLLVVNLDSKSVNHWAGTELVELLTDFSYENGSQFFKVIEVENRETAEEMLKNRDGAALIIIPNDFSSAVSALKNGESVIPTNIEFIGDLTFPTYTVAAVSAMTVADNFIKANSQDEDLIGFVETPLGASSARSEFENYVPGLFVLAIVLMIFQASMMPVRESEDGKLVRLKMAGIRSVEFLGGISLWLIVISVASVGLTFITALLLGFRSQGPLWLALLILIITSISIIGVGMIVASFAKTISQAFVLANFPLGFLMFLSGSAFPLPRKILFNLAGHGVSIYDIIAPTHAVIALNKIFTLGGKLGDVAYELSVLIILSIIYFGIGGFLYQRRNLNKTGK